MAYVGGTKRSGCVFCDALAAGDDRNSLIVYRGERAFIMLNLYPYNSGHSMVVPYDHVPTIEELDPATRAELLELATLAVEASRRVLHCDGFNLGLNLGAVAGAGVADHLHMHVVPRWTGDANFMPILGDTMVMPELLPSTYARLRGEIEAIAGERAGRPVAAAGALVAVPGAGVAVVAAEGGPQFPVARIADGETTSAAALRAARSALGSDVAIAGWAGVEDDALDERAAYFLVTASKDVVTPPGMTIVPAEALADVLGDTFSLDLVRENLPILARLAGDAE